MSVGKINAENSLIVDFSGTFGENVSATKSANYRQTAEKLVDVLKTYGYAYVKSDAVDGKYADEIMSAADMFFKLPYDVKMKYQLSSSSEECKNGYMGFDMERLDQKYEGAVEWRESYNLLDIEIPLEPEDDCPGMQAAYHCFFRRCKELLLTILRALAVHLEDENIFDSMYRHLGNSRGLGALRTLNYPPQSAESGKEITRCGAHADYDIITLNFQDDVGGLQMLSRKTGEYVPAPNIPGTVLIQAGLALEKMTDGLFTGTFHRVIQVASSEDYERKSIAFFGVSDPEIRLKNLFRYHVNEDGDEDVVTSRDFLLKLYKASFK